MKIITGYTGEKQITSDNDASIFTGIIGRQNYVFNSMNNLGYQLMGNNVIRIKSGVVNYGGRNGIIEEYEDVKFENGRQGVTRTDVLVARYAIDELTGIESMKLVMITGTSSVPAKPLNTDFPLYKITLSGVNVASVVPQFDILLSMKELKELINNTASSFSTALNHAQETLRSEYKNADSAVTTAFQNADKNISANIENLRNSANKEYASIAADIHAINENMTRVNSMLSELDDRVIRLENK